MIMVTMRVACATEGDRILSFRYAISGCGIGRERGLQLLTAFAVDATYLNRVFANSPEAAVL